MPAPALQGPSHLPRTTAALARCAERQVVPLTARMLLPDRFEGAQVWRARPRRHTAQQQPLSAIVITATQASTGQGMHALGLGTDPLLRDFYVGAATRVKADGTVEAILGDQTTEGRPLLTIGPAAANGTVSLEVLHTNEALLIAEDAAQGVTAETARLRALPDDRSRYVWATAIYWSSHESRDRRVERFADDAQKLIDAVNWRTSGQRALAVYQQNSNILDKSVYAAFTRASEAFEKSARLFLQLGEVALAADAYLWCAACSGMNGENAYAPDLCTTAWTLFEAMDLPFGQGLTDSWHSRNPPGLMTAVMQAFTHTTD